MTNLVNKALRFLPCLALPLAAACGPQDSAADTGPDKFRDAVPSADDLKLRTPGGDVATGTTGARPGASVQSPSGASGYAQFYRLTRAIFDGVNAGTSIVLGTIWIVAHTPPTSTSEHEAVWGPGADALSPAEWRLRITEISAGKFTFAWEGRKKGSSDAFRATMTGTGYGKADPRHGVGQLVIDYDAANELDPARLWGEGTSGTLTLDYDVTGLPSLGGASTIHVVARPTKDDRVFEVTAKREGRGGGGRVDFTTHDDVDDAKKTAAEDVSLHSRWAADGSGRAEVTIAGGDVPKTVSAVHVTECWSKDFARSFYTDDVGLAATDGNAALCAFATASE